MSDSSLSAMNKIMKLMLEGLAFSILVFDGFERQLNSRQSGSKLGKDLFILLLLNKN